MTSLDRWNLASAKAASIVAAYRAQAPEGFDPLNFEGIVAGVVAAGVASAAISAGASAYSSSQQTSAQEKEAEALGKKPKIVPANFEDPSTAYSEYNNLVQTQYPQLEQDANTFNTTDNSNYQRMLSGVSPSLLPAIKTQGQDASSLLAGQIPGDVQGEIKRDTAQQTLTGGYGAGSGASRALTARDLGTTSLNLMNQGSSLLGQNLANAKAVSPFDTTGDSLLLTPQQELSRDDANNAYANGVLNANANISYQNSLYQTAANSYNPFGAGVVSGVGALSGASGQRAIGTVGQAVGNYFSQPSSSDYTYGATQQNAAAGYYNPYTDPSMYNADGTYIGSGYGGG